MGYSAGSSDCIMSFSRWQKLIAARIEKVVRPAVCAGLRVAVAWLKKGLLREASQCAGFAAESLSPKGVGGPNWPDSSENRPVSQGAAHIPVRRELRTIFLLERLLEPLPEPQPDGARLVRHG